MKEGLNEITERDIGAAIAVHRELGPGLLESAYEACLAHELAERGLAIERQKGLPVAYRGVKVDCGYRIDLLVEGLAVRCKSHVAACVSQAVCPKRRFRPPTAGGDAGRYIVVGAWPFCTGLLVVVELKAVDRLDPIHEAQLLSYLKLSGCRVGLLVNFNVKVLKDGIRRMVHDFAD